MRETAQRIAHGRIGEARLNHIEIGSGAIARHVGHHWKHVPLFAAPEIAVDALVRHGLRDIGEAQQLPGRA